jgi:hypothetical protein
MSAQGSRNENPGDHHIKAFEPRKGSAIGEPFQGYKILVVRLPRVVASSNPGLKLANAFGVFQTELLLKRDCYENVKVTSSP